MISAMIRAPYLRLAVLNLHILKEIFIADLKFKFNWESYMFIC